MTFGVIIGNRGFFPDHLAKTGREEMMRALERAGIEVVVLTPEQTKYGAVETHEDAKRCAALFQQNRQRLDGVIVALPNFGDERAIADTLRLARLDVPVLVQATPDNPANMTIAARRDSFCGKMSAFNTVRYSEKLLEAQGISVETIDLSEIFGRIARLPDNDAAVGAKLAEIRKYVSTSGVPEPALIKMAKLGAVIDGWMKAADVTVSAVQCWTSMEEYFGVVPCTVMSMMSDNLIPSACEVDVCGTISMHALRLASETPSALLDWNNNYGDNPDKAVCFHCSNLPKHFFQDVRMDFQEIIAGTVGKENTYGTCVGRVKAGAMSYARFSTDDTAGVMRGYVGEGAFTSDPLNTFGGAGVVEIPKLQDLLHFICANGFEHHVAANFSTVAQATHEATTRYLGWQMHLHRA